VAAVLLAACGGGGGAPDPSPSIIGYVVKGPVGGAAVALYQLAADGSRTLLASTTTGADGAYRFELQPADGAVLLVEAAGGSFIDEASGSPLPLDSVLRAVVVGNGGQLRVSVTPFSELAVREIAADALPQWTAARANAANAAIADATGFTLFPAFTPVDFSNAQQLASATEEDFTVSLFLGGFSGLRQRLGAPGGPAPLDQALDALRTILDDPYEDRYNPLLMLALVDFIDGSALLPDVRRSLKGLLLLQSEFVSDAQIAAALPRGSPGGSASAPMPNDTLELVPDPSFVRVWPVGTLFNSRGALYAHGISTSFGTYKYLYSGNVAELYGDGEIGIGRWRGGVMFDALDGAGLEQVANPQILAEDNGVVYAAALPATGLPVCGMRTLSHVASTSPTQTAGSGIKPVAGLTADSALSVQYAGNGALVGFDIGLLFTDGSIHRVASTGGLATPWASGIQTDSNGGFAFSITPSVAPPQLPGLRLEANGILAGGAGRKVAAKLRTYSTQVDAMTLAAAFSGPDSVDTGGCAVGGGDGSAVVPPLPDGAYWTFAGTDSTDGLYMGVQLLATFSPSGSLLTAGHGGQPPQLSIPSTTSSFELHGNAYATVGRARGAFTLRGNAHDRSLPFAVAQAAMSLPASGIHRYVLVDASAAIAVAQAGGSLIELPPGQVSAATVDVNFGEYPWGTASAFYGSVRYSIAGQVAGASFGFSNPLNSLGVPSDSRYFRDTGTFSEGAVEGALSGPNGEFMVLRYRASIGSSPVQGALMLHAPQ